ncbi:uncharacterized protein LOC128849202 [Cuculus canorus]|uniref:uncharacterized protein LOC128849202 n=1 Tax=Cuculus canorus TaxID=55661 RepID=UPI0023AA63FA|nr:uncharacterized protein LOC128849202 [Cuculus canorus]
METEAAATLLVAILSKRGHELPAKLLIKLLHLGRKWGHFTDPHTMFFVTEWRDYGETLWQKTISRTDNDEKEVKAVRGDCTITKRGKEPFGGCGETWRTVLNTLQALKAESKVAAAAVRATAPPNPPAEPHRTTSRTSAFFGVSQNYPMKGMTGKVCTGVCELLNPTVKRGNASEDINGPVAPQAPDVHPSEGGSAMTQEPEVPTVAAALIKCGAARAVGLARNQRRKKVPRKCCNNQGLLPVKQLQMTLSWEEVWICWRLPRGEGGPADTDVWAASYQGQEVGT